MVIRIFKSLLILTLLLNPAASMAAQLEAVTDRTRVGLEESFNLELRASGSIDGDPDLSVLENDFEILGRSQSSQMQIINSDISRTTIWSLSLLARSAGRKTIPSICITSECSKPMVIDVLPAGQNLNGASGESDLLLEVSATPDKLWVQSQLLYKVRILTRLNFLQASLSEPEPSGIEAVVQKLGDDRNYETERNGLRYRVIERSYAIFPQQSGPLTIPAIRFGAQIVEPGSRGYDLFNQRTRQIRKRSKEIKIEVLPAADVKGRSWLPANNLGLEDDWQQPPQLTVGEPATRTITLRASGLPSAQLPPINVEIPEGVRSYPDQPNREDQFNENGMLGILQQKLALVPTKPGTLRLPDIKIDWWDLRVERWQQVVLPAIELEVLPATDQPATVSTSPAEQLSAPKVGQKQQAGEPQTRETTESGFWFWLSLVLGFGWLLTLLLITKGKFARDREKNKQAGEEKTLSRKAAYRELQQAIKSDEQTRVRNALLKWGVAFFPEQQPGNLEELAVLCGEPLKQQLEAFSRNIYSRDVEPWNSDELLRVIKQVESEKKEGNNVDKLPPLYPK